MRNKYLFLDTPIETLRKEIVNEKYNQFVRLYQECERRIRQPLSKEHPKMSSTFIGVTIVNLALAYLLTNEDKFLTHAKRWMMTVCEYKEWGFNKLVNVDLSAAWILFGLSVGYDWLKDELTPSERDIVFKKLCLQAKIMYDYKIETEGHGWSTQFFQNHNWINMTGLAAAGYALGKENKEYLKYAKISKQNFEKVYEYLADDGSNYEGVPYWRYGGMWLFVYAHLLKVEEGIDYFKSCNYLKNTFFYRLYQSTGNFLHPMDFGDSHDYYSSHTPAVYYKVASEYNNGYAQKLANLVLKRYLYQEGLESHVKPGILSEACFEFLWYNPKIEEKDFQELPTSKFFPDLGLLYLRSSWDEDATVFSVKCGYPGGKKQWLIGWEYYFEKNWKILSLSHHHPDNNSFILNRRNFPMIIDDGYNREAKPDHHNGIMVDGKIFEVEEKSDIYMHSIYQRLKDYPNYNPIKDYHGKVTLYETNGSLTLFQGENHLIYKPDLKMKKVTRTIVTPNLDYVIVIDDVESEIDHEYTLVMNTPVKASIMSPHHYEYHSGINKMAFDVFASVSVKEEFKTNHITTIFTPQEPDVIKSEYLQSLQLTTDKTRKVRFVQVISYCDIGTDVPYKVTNLNESNITIKGPNWVDYYFEGSVNNDFIKTDSSKVYFRLKDQKVMQMIIIEGSYLYINNEIVFKNEKCENFVWSNHEISK